jgi:hypothetical protein
MWENDIKVGLTDIRYENVVQIHLIANKTQKQALVKPQGSTKGWKLLNLMCDYLLLQNGPIFVI